MKLLNLTILLTSLVLSTACEITSDSSSGSSNKNSGTAKLQSVVKDMQHNEGECPVLEGQYLDVWSRDTDGTPMEYSIFYALSGVNTEGQETVDMGDNMVLIIDGSLRQTKFEGITLNYAAACSNGVLTIAAAQGKNIMESTYETYEDLLITTSKGVFEGENIDESTRAYLDNNFVDPELSNL